MKYIAIFKKEEIGYSVSFPAINGCFTEGDTKEKAIANATEALTLALETYMSINPSSELPEDANIDYELKDDDFIELIEFKLSPEGDNWGEQTNKRNP
jgi:predicted RNase H-like HicB family nuclease